MDDALIKEIAALCLERLAIELEAEGRTTIRMLMRPARGRPSKPYARMTPLDCAHLLGTRLFMDLAPDGIDEDDPESVALAAHLGAETLEAGHLAVADVGEQAIKAVAVMDGLGPDARLPAVCRAAAAWLRAPARATA